VEYKSLSNIIESAPGARRRRSLEKEPGSSRNVSHKTNELIYNYAK
jgi:hypothetical protein